MKYNEIKTSNGMHGNTLQCLVIFIFRWPFTMSNHHHPTKHRSPVHFKQRSPVHSKQRSPGHSKQRSPVHSKQRSSNCLSNEPQPQNQMRNFKFSSFSSAIYLLVMVTNNLIFIIYGHAPGPSTQSKAPNYTLP